MRKKVRKELMVRFPRELERCLPQFKRQPTKSEDPTWAWQLAPDLTFFVVLILKDNEDEFFIDVAWSDDGKFPWDSDQFGPPNVDSPRLCKRLARLWATGKMEDSWYIDSKYKKKLDAWLGAAERGKIARSPDDSPEEEVVQQVAPFVEDAVQKLIQFGIPLFRRVAEHRGVAWSTG